MPSGRSVSKHAEKPEGGKREDGCLYLTIVALSLLAEAGEEGLAVWTSVSRHRSVGERHMWRSMV
jgi:hypothetical protein